MLCRVKDIEVVSSTWNKNEGEKVRKEAELMWKTYKEKGMGVYESLGRTPIGRFMMAFYENYNAHSISTLAAESTYYLILAIVPFIVFFLNVILFFASNQIQLVFNFLALLPDATEAFLRPIIVNLVDSRSQTVLSLGIAIAFWSTAKGVQGLIRALNIVLGTEGRENNIIMIYLKAIVFTFLWVFSAVGSLLLMVYGDALFVYVAKELTLPEDWLRVWRLAALVVPLIGIMLTLTVFYRYAPKYREVHRLSWKKSFFSAFIGAILWILITVLYRIYIGNLGSMSITYGPLVGLMALFIWINYSVRAVLLGAEFVITLDQLNKKEL